MAETRRRGVGKRAFLLFLLFCALFVVTSGVYREQVNLTTADRGMARPGMGIANSLPVVESSPEGPPIRVLSLDAGGIRGILELHVLAHLEETSGRPVSELFDLVVGTSTGSAITVGLLLPDENGAPKFSARELLSLYEEQVRSFNEVPWHHTLFTLDGWIGPRYSVEPSTQFVRRHYGTVPMSDLLGDAVVAMLDLETLEPKFIASRQSARSGGRTLRENFLAGDVVMGCCAVPGYVPPMIVRNVEGDEVFVGIDGGTFAFSPAAFAISEAAHRYPGRRIKMLSLGTGMVQGGWTAEDARSWGSIDWARATLPVVLRSQVRYTEEVLEKLASDEGSSLETYLRLNPSLPEELEQALVTSPNLVPRLGDLGREMVATRQQDIHAMLGELVRD
ncbi:MAG: patatin-like phospholipase family protein [Phycisphaerales bacterium]|nr:patatin-like phospholipase family protein [Phycisphaerales bacterium]